MDLPTPPPTNALINILWPEDEIGEMAIVNKILEKDKSESGCFELFKRILLIERLKPFQRQPSTDA